MKTLLLLILLLALFGCASTPPNAAYAGGWITPNGVPMDPTYPGYGPHVGVGVGSWGGRTGGGIGFGLGF
ncbi:MAG: hypothetical protein WBG17_14300 [Burkholderiaceae bacterium]